MQDKRNDLRLIMERLTMTQEKWAKLNHFEKETIRATSDKLSPQLNGLEGARVEVVDKFGETRRFWVGKSTGWAPIHIELKNTRSSGGMAADREYQSVRVVRKGRDYR